VLVFGLVTVIRFNDLVKEWSESVIGVMRAGINTNSRIRPFCSGEDTLLECEPVLILLVFASGPGILGQALTQK